MILLSKKLKWSRGAARRAARQFQRYFRGPQTARQDFHLDFHLQPKKILYINVTETLAVKPINQ